MVIGIVFESYNALFYRHFNLKYSRDKKFVKMYDSLDSTKNYFFKCDLYV